MQVVKLGSRNIKIYFNEKAVDKYEKEKNKGSYVHGYIDSGLDEIYIRESLSPTLKRICLFHELGHAHFDCLHNLGNETIAELLGRFIDEVFSRNKWVRGLY